MTTTDTSARPAFWRRRWVQVTGATLVLMIVSGGSAAAATELASHPAVVQRPAAATAPARPKAPAPAKPNASAKPSPKASAPSQAPAQQAPANPAPSPSRSDSQYPSSPSTPQLTNAVAVVSQYYQDITDQNYAAAWVIGGRNIAAQNGQTYASWAAGYSTTTASISITEFGTWSNGTVWCDISATQLNGSVNTYYGTYSVSDGVIVSASIHQTG
jgi:hypothetical protein